MKSLLPRPVKRAVRSLVSRFDAAGIRLFAVNGVLSSAYYLLCSRRFDREHRAVLRGRIAYEHFVEAPRRSSAMLRRNIHRVEKGLIMEPRRDRFGEDYIAETIDCYERVAQTPDYCEREIRWATDVLDEYFEVVAESNVTRAAKDRYHNARESAATPRHEHAYKPYARSMSPSVSVSFDELSELFVRRRSVRWYLDKEVPLDVIRKAVHAAAQAPSACNRQPFRFIVTNTPAQATRIAECAGGTRGFADNIPAILTVVGDLAAYPGERDRHLIYIDSALASMQLMLAAETLGLSTCPINWPDVDRAEIRIRELLDLADYERVVMLIAVGYGKADSGIPYSQKKGDLLMSTWGAEP